MNILLLKVIINYRSGFVTYRKITKTKSSQKGFQFPPRAAPYKINSSGKFAVICDSSKISLVPQEHLIRMHSDEHDNVCGLEIQWQVLDRKSHW